MVQELPIEELPRKNKALRRKIVNLVTTRGPLSPGALFAALNAFEMDEIAAETEDLLHDGGIKLLPSGTLIPCDFHKHQVPARRPGLATRLRG